MKIGELFSGYGGLGMGVQAAMGGEIAWHSDIDAGACKILAHRYPGAPNLGDVTAIDWSSVEPVDVLTGGFPCQDLSDAGRRVGILKGKQSGLWSEMATCVRLVRPRLVVVENVRGLLGRGMGRVLGDLAELGYDARWESIRASDVGAPHGRQRVFIVATDATGDRWHEGRPAPTRFERRPDAAERGSTAADTGRTRLRKQPRGAPAEEAGTHASDQPAGDRGPRPAADWGPYGPAIQRWAGVVGRPAPRPTELRQRGQRLSPRFVEWLMGLPDGWVTDVPGITRNEALRALGNGVVPQQAEAALRFLLSVQEVPA